MKSIYSTTHPLMKVSSPEIMSSRPLHEKARAETVVVTTVPVPKNAEHKKKDVKK